MRPSGDPIRLLDRSGLHQTPVTTESGLRTNGAAERGSTVSR
jgi:hypothetical protein